MTKAYHVTRSTQPPDARGPSVDLAQFLRLHRGPDGSVPLALINSIGDWVELGSVDVAKARAIADKITKEPCLFPELEPLLRVDGYATVNTFWKRPKMRLAEGVERERIRRDEGVVWVEAYRPTKWVPGVNSLTNLPLTEHSTDNLRWLNQAYVDLDCYKLGVDVPDVMAGVMRLYRSGAIPPPSMFVESGRGLWPVWWLVDDRNPAEGTIRILDRNKRYGVVHGPLTPQRAYPRAITLLVKVQAALRAKLQEFGPDPNATDAARFMRLCGSQNRSATEAAGRPIHVIYHYLADANNQPFYYTLPQLADFLSVDTPRRPTTVLEFTARRVLDDEQRSAASANGLKGHRQRWCNLVEDFDRLISHRGGGFVEGCRNVGLYFYVFALLKSGVSFADAESQAWRVGGQCRPALSPPARRAAVKAARKAARKSVRGPSHATIRAALGISEDEARAAHLRYLVPLPCDGMVIEKRDPLPRRAMILELVQTIGRIPTGREMSGLLKRRGFDVSHVTITQQDYPALGLRSVSRGGRRPKLELPS